MTDQEWQDPALTSLAMCRADEESTFFLVVHGNGQDTQWCLPQLPTATYEQVVDTAATGWGLGRATRYDAGSWLPVRAWSAVLLRCRPR